MAMALLAKLALSPAKRVVPVLIALQAAATVLLLVAMCGPLRAEEEGTFAQRRACKPDVFRLCKEFIPNRSAITSCLQRNKPRLSPDCRAVFEGSFEVIDAVLARSDSNACRLFPMG